MLEDSATLAERSRHVLIGTAGHIDHGKTRLVGRLSKIDTDRLPEEKSRGISIDLGFAHWEALWTPPPAAATADEVVATAGAVSEPNAAGVPPFNEPVLFRFGIVDVPGHERFVKNMVAGATGIDMALLVVAADDGVMPQTREHLEIMDLLGVRTGLVAITKTDLVDEEFVELVRAEIEDLVAGTFLQGCPIVAVSSETGAGFEELEQTIVEVAASTPWTDRGELFRMPIDRVFTIAGHGTIVTGSVISGEVHAGDTLELLPQQRALRVRSVQNHGTATDDSGAHQRTAINLAGVKVGEIQRGCELATPEYLKPTRRMLVELRVLSSSPVILKDRLELNLHLGTAEVAARIILKGKLLKPGDTGFGELRTREPVVAAWGQRFILRRPSPALTVAGGTVLDPCLPLQRRIRDLEALGGAMAADSVRERLSCLLARQDVVASSPLEAARRAGVPCSHYGTLLKELQESGELLEVGPAERPLLVHRERLQSVAASVMRTIREELARHQPRRALPRSTILAACREIAAPELLEAVLVRLEREGELVAVGANLGPADAQVRLTKAQAAARDRIVKEIEQAGLQPPTVKELAALTRLKTSDVETLLNVCVEDGLLVRISDTLYFTPAALEQARRLCRDHLAQAGESTMSALREAWGISRKFAVPLCEFFDERSVTIRRGDVRVAGPHIDSPIV